MICKTDWTQYLHAIRRREIEIVLALLPKKQFTSGLEIGAGDGFQTTLLAPLVEKLISSDLNFNRIKESLKVPGVEYKILDADAIEGMFRPNSFDLIFSSNVLEHVRDSLNVLISTRPMLKDDGYAVHIIPSRPLKIFYLLLHYPNLMLLAVDRILGKLKGKPFFQGANINLENNINLAVSPPSDWQSRLRKFLLPSVHGNFPNHREEFIAFGKREWDKKFREAGYNIATYKRGPAFSGFGFGFNRVRKLLERFGVSSEHIFILKKTSHQSAI